MKIAGKSLVSVPVFPVTLTRPDGEVLLQVSPMSPGFDSRMKRLGLLVFPPVPTKPLMNGKAPWRKGNGEIQVYSDDGDPAFLEKCGVVMERITALRVADALRNDPNVEFSAVPPPNREKKAWERYADELVEEINDPQSGFLLHEVNKILDVARSGQVTVDTEGAKNEFLGELDRAEGESLEAC